MQASNQLVVLERQLQPLAPRLAQVLGKTMPVERLIRTVMVSVERLPKLLDCDRQSLFNAAMSAAVLGLEVDGVTGQAYLIPFKGKAQLVIGYKGYNTLAARSGITITGSVVREGDSFDYQLGSDAFVRHVPTFGNKGRIIGAWACATSANRPPVVAVMDIDELLAVKGKSPGAQRNDSPWNDPHIGFPAMCEKTVKRRLARSLPLNIMQLASRIDESVDEQGSPAWVSPDNGVVLDGEIVPTRHDDRTPAARELIGDHSNGNGNGRSPSDGMRPAAPEPRQQGDTPQGSGADNLPTFEAYSAFLDGLCNEATDAAELAEAFNSHQQTHGRFTDEQYDDLLARVNRRCAELERAAKRKPATAGVEA